MVHPIQIAGVIDRDEADLLRSLSVDWMGFPLGLRDGREDLSANEARRIIEETGIHDRAVLITYLDRAREMDELAKILGVSRIQIHGSIVLSEMEALRSLRPGDLLIKSLIVTTDNAEELHREVELWSPWVDAFLTDTYDSATGRRGATGKVHDWEVSQRLVRRSSRPVLLAGGLNEKNVASAIDMVRPWGVDAHTGVEGPDGRKDPDKVAEFVARSRRAFQGLEARRTKRGEEPDPAKGV